MRRLVVLVALSQSGCGLFLEGPRPPDAAVSDVDAPRPIDAFADARQMDDAFGDDAPADDAFREDAPTDDAYVSEPDAGTCPADMCGEIASRMGVVDIDVSEDGTRAVMLGTAGAWLYGSIAGTSTTIEGSIPSPGAGCAHIAVSDIESSAVILCGGEAHRINFASATSSNLGMGYVAVASGGTGRADTFALVHVDGYVELLGAGAQPIRHSEFAPILCTNDAVWNVGGGVDQVAMHPMRTSGVFMCDLPSPHTIAVRAPTVVDQTFYGDSASSTVIANECQTGSCCAASDLTIPTENFVDLSVLPNIVATISGDVIRFPRNGDLHPISTVDGAPLTSVSLGMFEEADGVPTRFMAAWSSDYGAYAHLWSSSTCTSDGALRFHAPADPLTKLRISRCAVLASESEPHFTAITLEEGGLATLRRVTCPLP